MLMTRSSRGHDRWRTVTSNCPNGDGVATFYFPNQSRTNLPHSDEGCPLARVA